MKDKENAKMNNAITDFPPATPSIDYPDKTVPYYDPPVPNRAWTAMKSGKDIDELSEEERRMLYYGRDTIL